MLWNKEKENLVFYDVELTDNYYNWLREILVSQPKEKVEYELEKDFFQTEYFSFGGGKLVKLGFPGRWYYVTSEEKKVKNSYVEDGYYKTDKMIYHRTYQKSPVPNYFWEVWNLQSANYYILEKALLKEEDSIREKLKDALILTPKDTIPYSQFESVLKILEQEKTIFNSSFSWQQEIYELPLDVFEKDENFKVKAKG